MRPRLPQETSYGPGVQLTSHDPLAVAATTAIRDGDLEALRRLLVGNPELASASVGAGDGTGRSMLHIATDWPGHFPNNVETVKLLIAAGADVNARFHGALSHGKANAVRTVMAGAPSTGSMGTNLDGLVPESS